MEIKKTLHDTIAHIEKMIDSRAYSTGDRLPNERQLVKDLNVSRAVIRHAKAVLQAQGRIENIQGKGAFILPKVNQMKMPIPVISEIELAEARTVLEGESIALAARQITDEVIKELETYVDIMSGKTRSLLTPDEADKAFHITIAKSTNNDVIELCVENLWNMRTEPKNSQIIRGTTQDAGFQERIDEHLAIIDALKKRNSTEARQAMQTHCQQVKKKFSTVS